MLAIMQLERRVHKKLLEIETIGRKKYDHNYYQLDLHLLNNMRMLPAVVSSKIQKI